MALASRLLSRSKQLYAGQIILRNEHWMPGRSYAKVAAPSGLPPLKGDGEVFLAFSDPSSAHRFEFQFWYVKGDNLDGLPPCIRADLMLKNIFYEVKNKFETAIGILRKEKFTIDPDDTAAVSQFAKIMKTVREKAGLYSESEKFKYTIEQRTQGIPDARTYLLTLKEIRIKSGLVDNFGAEVMMMEALDKVEKEIKGPLLRSDKKNMALLQAEFDKINKKLGIRMEDFPKYEEDLELKIAKADLVELKSDVVEAMETQLKREEFKDEKMVDPKTLDIRNFL